MRPLTAGEVCKLLSSDREKFPPQTLDRWCAAGIVRPLNNGKGKGNHRRFRFCDVLAIAVGRGLRGMGFSQAAAGEAMQVLMRHTAADFAIAFGEGRTALMMMGATVCPRLTSPDSVLSNPDIDYALSAEMGMMPIAIDVRRVHDRMVACVARLPPVPKRGRRPLKTQE